MELKIWSTGKWISSATKHAGKYILEQCLWNPTSWLFLLLIYKFIVQVNSDFGESESLHEIRCCFLSSKQIMAIPISHNLKKKMEERHLTKSFLLYWRGIHTHRLANNPMFKEPLVGFLTKGSLELSQMSSIIRSGIFLGEKGHFES